MKKLYIFALVAMLFAACATDAIDEQSVKVEEQTPDTLVGTFEGDDSRIQLQNGKTVWTKDDLVSVFYRSNANQKWQYQGETGERTGTIKRVANAEATQELSDIVVVYPYNENYYINPRTYNVQALLPAEQTYLANSYGLDGNIMISASEYKSFSLKNVCGWLKIQLTGTSSQKVTSITLKGNNGEQVAGEIYINSADASCELASKSGVLGDDLEVGGTIFEDGTVLTSVTLNCGEGVALGSTAKSFYIALPPQTFEKGLTIDVACSDGSTMTKSTTNAITIERNAIQPMAAFVFVNPNAPTEPTPASNEIWYTATEKVEPYYDDEFGSTLLSNTYNSNTKEGVLTFDGDVTKIGSRAFYECKKLTSITIPNSITTIGKEAFYGCTSITSITIPNSVTTIEKKAFAYCTSLKEFKGKFAADDGRCLIINRVLNSFANGCGTTEYNIPDGVTTIGGGAFYECFSLTTINIPTSVKIIEEYAFYWCGYLTSVTIPDSVTTIGESAFKKCNSLTSVTIPISVTTIEGSAFYDCPKLKSVYCNPTTPPSLGSCVFWFTNLGHIYVPTESIEAYKSANGWKEYADDIVGYDF